MKSPTEPSKKPSMPLLFQSFGVNDNFHSNYSSRLKSKHKPSDVCSPQPSDCQSNYRLACQSSRKKLEPQESVIQSHYQNMEKILLNENLNLKQQNAFLTSEIRRSIKHQQKLKEDKKNLVVQLKQSSEQINHLDTQLTSSKDFIQNQLYYLSEGLKSNNIQQLKNIVMRFIDSLSAQFQFQIQKLLPKSLDQTSFDRPFDQSEIKSQVQQEIDNLTKKLEKLLQQDHSPNKGPSVRRQCIELSKQIKQLKQKSRMSNSNQQINESMPTNHFQRSSIQSSNSLVRDNITMKRQVWHSEVSKESPQDQKKSYPQIYSKATRRKSLNRENKSVRETSPVLYKTSQSKFK